MQESTKIVGGLSEFKEDKKPNKSLRTRIEEAKTADEVHYLLGVGGKYDKVSNGTMRTWAKVAAKRLEALGSK